MNTEMILIIVEALEKYAEEKVKEVQNYRKLHGDVLDLMLKGKGGEFSDKDWEIFNEWRSLAERYDNVRDAVRRFKSMNWNLMERVK